ncbi:MAG TPA: hypothetical protein VK663_03085 [Burkholderiales bacterium]|nr:hypothetical protein [Burkholderiales bacterium]
MNTWRGTQDADWEEMQTALAAAYLTDGLPIVPPTAERVDAMLAHNGYKTDQEISMLPPGFETATAGDVAICAVMAGCKPEYMPVLVAAVDALSDMSFNLVGIATTTGSAAPIYIVNGPIVDQIGLNAKNNVLGSGHRANATIGRAMTLILQNIGNAKPGEVDMATLGQPAKYSCCFAENVAESPWVPLHVERGFAPDASVVTVVGIGGTVEVVDSDSPDAAGLAQTFAQSMLIAGTSGGAGLLGGGEPLCILPPEWAALFDRDGYSKQKTKAAIWELATLPIDKLAPAVRKHRMAAASDPTASVIRVAEKADDLMIVVAGGVGRKAAYAPTWGGTTKAISREIKFHNKS